MTARFTDPKADPSLAQAVNYAAAYSGTMPFMVEMRSKARQPGWRPTPRQMQAIVNCARHDGVDLPDVIVKVKVRPRTSTRRRAVRRV